MPITIGKVEECNLEINKWGGLDWTVTLYEEDENGDEAVRNLTGYTAKAEVRPAEARRFPSVKDRKGLDDEDDCADGHGGMGCGVQDQAEGERQSYPA